ncbi:hypothetical protein BaRGS_00032811 [Batillaria attramentaria]|uniref:Uncharacterized protein n=1 Tax=Batillaria attramentaria TaxID=370345 RepID=A0ABD0JN51_9CAEN
MEDARRLVYEEDGLELASNPTAEREDQRAAESSTCHLSVRLGGNTSLRLGAKKQCLLEGVPCLSVSAHEVSSVLDDLVFNMRMYYEGCLAK